MTLARRTFAILFAVLGVAAAIAAYLAPYRPVVVAGPPAPAGPYALPPPVAGLRLHVFVTGMNRMGDELVPPPYPAPWRPAPAFVIEHPREGLVVFDTGLSPEVARIGEAALPLPMPWFFESRGVPGRTLDAQMRAAGLDPERVRTVILSHLHEDHTGAVAAFPSAQVIAGPGSRARAVPAVASRWRELAPADLSTPLAPFDRTLDLFGDRSLVLLHGGGHTEEDLMALVALPGGPALLTGDAAPHAPWLRSDDVERVAGDPTRAADVRNRVRALAAAIPSLVIAFGHDIDAVPLDRGDLVVHEPSWRAPEEWPISGRVDAPR